jgi:ubiquinone/menaquinone biosynthesis C-methylase UbiE
MLVRVNLFHRWYCGSKGWARQLEQFLPMTVRCVELGDHLLEIGPGPGLTTDWLRQRVPRLTSIEIDRKLADRLKARLAGTNVTVVEGDASAMPFPDSEFSAVMSYTMLHHVPAAVQDRLLAEACRVVRDGGAFVGVDSTPSFRWNLYHLFDDRNPADPATFEGRLRAAGFAAASVQTWPGGFGWRASKP